MKKKALKFSGHLLLALAGLEVLYVLAGNWALRSGALARLLSRKPEKLSMQWSSGRTFWPGIVHLGGMRLRGQSERTQSYLQADRCTLRMHLFALAACRVHFYAVEADGVSLWVRRRREPGKPHALDRHEPPIPGLAQDDPPPKRKRTPSPWTFHFGGAKVTDLREIWIGPYRAAGQGRAAGEADYRLRGALAVDESRALLQNVTVRVGEEVIASNLDLQLDARVRSVVPREHRGRPFLRFVSGRCEASGDVGGLGFLNEAFGGRSPLAFQGVGRVAADLFLDRGVVGPGSSFSWEGSALSASSAGLSASGKGSFSGETDGAGTAFSLAARWSEIAVSGEGFAPVILEGPGLTATLTGPVLDLASDAVPLTVVLDLPQSVLRDLSAVNGLLPSKLPLSVLPKSEVLLRGRVELKGTSAEGSVSIEGKTAGVRLGGPSLRGGFFSELKLACGDLPSRSFDVSGTRVGFRGATFSDAGGHPSDNPWTGEARLERATLHLKAPLGLQSNLSLAMSDTRPVVAALAAESKAAGWFKGVLTVRDVTGSADVKTSEHRTALRHVDVRGGGLQLLANVQMEGGRTDGALYAQLHHLSACILFDGRDRHWKLIGARKAYDERFSTMGR
jgi:hypothetical protein